MSQGGGDRHTFESFEVEEGNREAFENCSSAANRHPVIPSPLVICGPDGSGKTHLLHAVVDRVRHHRDPSAIAAVSSSSFPSAVRALINDHSPLENLPFAVLLVDGIDAMGEDLEDVLKLMHLFMEEEFPVVVAATSIDGEDASARDYLSEILSSGTVVPIEARRAGTTKGLATHTHDSSVTSVVDVTETESSTSQDAAHGLLERTEQLLDELGERQTFLSDARASQQERLREIQHLEGLLARTTEQPSHSASRLTDFAESELNALHDRFTKDQSELRDTVHTVQESFDQELDDLKTSLERTQEESRKTREELDAIRGEQAGEESEVERVRRECEQLKGVLMQVKEERELTKSRLRNAHDKLDELEREEAVKTSAKSPGIEERLAVLRHEQFASIDDVSAFRLSLQDTLRLLDEDSPSDSLKSPVKSSSESDTTASASPVATADVQTKDQDAAPRAFKPSISLHHVEQLDDTLDLLGENDG